MAVATGYKDIHRVLLLDLLGFDDAKHDKKYCLGLRDDYAWWEAHDENDTSGKLLLADPTFLKECEEARARNEKARLSPQDILEVRVVACN